MTEREMQDLIAEFPNDFDCFRNKRLRLIRREGELPGFGRYDLLFEDKFGRIIVMELKVRISSHNYGDKVAEQVTRYQEGLGPKIEPYVVATSIPRNIQDFWAKYGIWSYEIQEPEFRRVAKQNGYPWPAEDPSPGPPKGHPSKAPGGGGGSRFIDKPMYDQTFQWVYVPVIRNEFSINELIDLLLKGVENRPQDDKVLNKLLGAGILPRSTEEGILKELIHARIYRNPPDPTEIRRQVIKWLERDLKPTATGYPWFAYVKYRTDSRIVHLNNENIEDVEDDEAIRMICRPKWFDDCGRKPEMKYYGGPVPHGREGQEKFYGRDGQGGRFPLRRNTPVPGDVA